MEEIDQEMLREMLAWLGRSIDETEEVAEPHEPTDVELTEEDHRFLRESGIAIPQ